MGFGHIWACGQKSGRDCLKQHVDGACLSHASWALSSTAKKRSVRKEKAEKAAQDAAVPAAASCTEDCPV
eukprot:1003465-Pleurochrysis_carterae.AAC.1